jgi:hypothetical protein
MLQTQDPLVGLLAFCQPDGNGSAAQLFMERAAASGYGAASQGGAVISTISGGQREFLAERSKNSRRADSLWAGARVDVLCS